MTNEELLKLQEEIKKLKEQRTKVLQIQKEISKLEKTPEVKKYLELKLLYNENTTGKNSGFDKFSDEDLVSIALGRVNVTPSDEIYVYIGTYKYSHEIDIVHGSSDIPVSRFNNDADYVVYKNLEAKYNANVYVPYKKANEFESNHKIIVPKNVASRERYYYDLQTEYFETMILESTDAANKKINKLIRK